MRKSLIILSIIFLLLPISVTAQSFDVLWQQVNQAERMDLPKTQISLLQQIERKAQKEKAYGQVWTNSQQYGALAKVLGKAVLTFLVAEAVGLGCYVL